jgi:TonB family protein
MGNWTASAWPILVSAALKSTLVLGAAWLITVLLRGRSAAARHIVWTACAAGLLALPVLSISLPVLRLTVANAVLPADGDTLVFHATTAAAAPSGTVTAPGPHAVPAAQVPAAARAAMGWRSVLLLVWAAGLLLALTQMLAACFALWRARRAARPSGYAALASSLARDLGIVDKVHVLEVPGGMPMTFGVLRPTVFVPSCAAEWSEDRRRVVLLHELAHVRRGDAATHLMARTALALNWWNPLAWSAWRAFLRERERAADDLVLTAGAAATDYAAHLLEIARTMQSPAPMAAAGVAMARSSQLEGRLLAILDSRTRRTAPGRAMGLTAAAIAIAMVAPLAAIRAQSKAAQAAPPDVEATILSANAQKNREILDQAAVSYEALRKFAEAKKLREAALALAEQVSGKESADYTMALIRLGDLARRYGTPKEADEFYNRALALGDRPGVFPALLRLALGSSGTDKEKAREYLERARVVGQDGNEVGTAMTWLAHERQDDPQGASYAESLYRGAMAVENAGSRELALTLEMYAEYLTANGRSGEAASLVEGAQSIRKARVAEASPKFAANVAAVKVGGGVSAPSLLAKVEPEYSEEARALKFQGTVLLQIVVDTDGKAKDLTLVRGLGHGLDEKAAAAIGLWKFKPGEQGGLPVPVKARIEVNFRLM